LILESPKPASQVESSPRKIIPILPETGGGVGDSSEEGVWGELYQAHQKFIPAVSMVFLPSGVGDLFS